MLSPSRQIRVVDSPNVGAHLQEHPLVYLNWHALQSATLDDAVRTGVHLRRKTQGWNCQPAQNPRGPPHQRERDGSAETGDHEGLDQREADDAKTAGAQRQARNSGCSVSMSMSESWPVKRIATHFCAWPR